MKKTISLAIAILVAFVVFAVADLPAPPAAAKAPAAKASTDRAVNPARSAVSAKVKRTPTQAYQTEISAESAVLKKQHDPAAKTGSCRNLTTLISSDNSIDTSHIAISAERPKLCTFTGLGRDHFARADV